MASTEKSVFPKAQAISLNEFIDYAQGAVVSKTLVKNKSGSITLFAFDEEQDLSEHTAPFDAFVQILEGEVEIKIDDDTVKLTAGQVVLMPANVPHALKAVSRFKMLLTMIRDKMEKI